MTVCIAPLMLVADICEEANRDSQPASHERDTMARYDDDDDDDDFEEEDVRPQKKRFKKKGFMGGCSKVQLGRSARILLTRS